MSNFTWLVSEPKLHEIVVRQRPIGDKTFEVAERVGKDADAILAKAPNRTGASKIKVSRGSLKVDAFVTLEDESHKAAGAIEFGHTNKKTKKYYAGPAPLRKAAYGSKAVSGGK